MVRPTPTTSNVHDDDHRDEKSPRQGLYEQRMETIYLDAQWGHCGFDESVDRFVEAILARTTDRYTPRGLAELEARVRAVCASDPRLRQALGADREADQAVGDSRGRDPRLPTQAGHGRARDSGGVHVSKCDQSTPELDLVCSARARRVRFLRRAAATALPERDRDSGYGRGCALRSSPSDCIAGGWVCRWHSRTRRR